MVAFESTLERDFIIRAEFDPLIRTVAEQPVRIYFADKQGKTRTYTPDFLITYHANGNYCREPMLVEVKPRADLIEQWRDLHPRLRAGARYAKRHGLAFRIATEQEIRDDVLANAKWLMQHRSSRISDDDLQAIVSTLKVLTKTTVWDLVEAAAASCKRAKEHLLAAVWYAIANGLLVCDQTQKITNSSEVRLPQ